MGDSHNIHRSMLQSVPQEVQHTSEEVQGNLLSQPSMCKISEHELDNIEIIRRYPSKLSRKSHKCYRQNRKLKHFKKLLKKMDDNHKQCKEKAQKETPLFMNKYLSVIKAKNLDFSHIEHIYVIRSNFDPIITQKEDLGMGPKTISSQIEIDYEKITPELLSMLNNATTVIVAQSANIHHKYDTEYKLNDAREINNSETGSHNIKNKCDSIKIPYFNGIDNFNKDFLCKVLNSFNKETGHLLSKTFRVCNCSNLYLHHEYSNTNDQYNIRSVPSDTCSALGNEPIYCLPCLSDSNVNVDKSSILYDHVPLLLNQNVNSEFEGKQELIDYEELYEKVTNQSTTRVKPINYNISISNNEQKLSSKKSELGVSKGTSNSNKSFIKRKVKRKKEKSKKLYKLIKVPNEQANNIKSEQCISRFTESKSSEMDRDSAYLKKANTLPGKLSKFKSQIVSTVDTSKICKDKRYVNNQLNVKSEPSEHGSDTNKYIKQKTFENSSNRVIALRERVVDYMSLVKGKQLIIKPEPSKPGTSSIKNTTNDNHSGSSVKAITLIKGETFNVKTEESVPGTKITKCTTKSTNSVLSKGAFALHEKKGNSRPLMKEEHLIIKSEPSDPSTKTTKSPVKATLLGSSKGAFKLRERIVNSKPLMKGELLNIKSEPYEPGTNSTKKSLKITNSGSSNGAIALCKKNTKEDYLVKQKLYKQGKDDKCDKIHKIYTVEDTLSNPILLHTGLDPVNGKKNNITIWDVPPFEVQSSYFYCTLHNSIIVCKYRYLDYTVVTNCKANLIPHFNGDCIVIVQYMSCISRIIISRDTYVCINSKTIQCNSINTPMNIYFDGILKRDGTIISIFVMWTGIKPNILNSYRLINGNPETADLIDIKGILCNRFDNKMIIKTHFDHNNYTFECSDSIYCRQILNNDKTFPIPNNINVNLYIRKTNRHYDNPIWTISWMILQL